MPGAEHRAPFRRLPALLLAVLAGVVPLLATPPAAAQEARAARQGGLTMDQAVEMAERRFHARVVRASREEENGRVVYVLRLLSDQGRVWTVRVDAETGQIY